MPISKAKRAEMRHILIGIACISGACAAVANLYCAVIYEGVFMAPRRGWAYLNTSPVRFYFSVVMSVLAVPSAAFFGYIVLRSAKDERVYFDPPPYAPRIEDPAKVSKHKR